MSVARRLPIAAAAASLALAACAGARVRPPDAPEVRRVAVLPVDNESGVSAPVRPLLGRVEAALRARGVEIVSGARVEDWLAAHRLRFTGAVPRDAAAAAREELGVDAVLVTVLEQWVPIGMPRVTIGMRLVSAEDPPRILWADAVARAGDEAPGLFGLGIVRSSAALQDRVAAELAARLRGYLAAGAPARSCPREPRFEPSIQYRSDLLDGEPRTVAVLPFVNETRRRRAGDVLADAFVRALSASGRFQVAEPGLVRESLLSRRVVMEGGVSLDTARSVLDAIDADLVLAGWIRDLSEDVPDAAPPHVEFTALLLDRRTEEVVWEVSSSHRGDEGVWAFDLGAIRSVNELACRMVASAAEHAARGPSTVSGAFEAARPRPAMRSGREATEAREATEQREEAP